MTWFGFQEHAFGEKTPGTTATRKIALPFFRDAGKQMMKALKNLAAQMTKDTNQAVTSGEADIDMVAREVRARGRLERGALMVH